MFKVQSVALTAALFSLTSGQGCYPTYSGGTYSSGDYVSGSYTTTDSTTEPCSPAGLGDCPSSGQKTTTSQVTKTYNFQCVEGANSAYCSDPAHSPVGTYFSGNVAWTNLGECTGTAAAPQATVPNAWTSGGCPSAYKAGTAYDAGDVVAVPKATYTAVYACKAEPTNQFCGQSGYEPGMGLYSDQAWDSLGSCTGTLAPTDSPSFEVLVDAGGCPGTYTLGDDYEPGDRVSKNGFVYECKAAPLGLHCPQDGYEPGGNTLEEGGTGGTPDAWKDAWSVVGYCSGSIAPTGSPSFVVLPNMGGCPNDWEQKSVGFAYEEGDTVSVDGKVFACKAWPFSAHCGQAGYEPLSSPDTTGSGAYEAWKDAWTLVGWCSGSILPTDSPSVDPANIVGACPDEWSSGSNTKYEEGDMVSVTVSTLPLRKVAYKCKAWPYSGHCGQYAPTNELGGPLGWTLAGSCDGSIGPTSSPSFDSINLIAGTEKGCPLEYNPSKTDYEAGDRISYTVSTIPERKIVLECREWPNTGYCNQAGFAPGSTYQSMAWTQKGYCDGTISPTPSPTPYVNTACTFDLQRDIVSTTTPTVSCTQGSSQDCTCTTTGTSPNQVTTCTRPNVISDSVISTPLVNIWSSSPALQKDYPNSSSTGGYQAGDVVRVSNRLYKCRQFPNENWCNQAAYSPENPTYPSWTEAWVADGTCP